MCGMYIVLVIAKLAENVTIKPKKNIISISRVDTGR